METPTDRPLRERTERGTFAPGEPIPERPRRGRPPSRRRAILAGHMAAHQEREQVFQRAYLRYLSTMTPEEAARVLQAANPTEVSTASKKHLFVELYKEMWPEKMQALRTVGVSLYWLRNQLQKDPEFAASILEIELARADAIKGFSYDQCFNPNNVAERMFWLRKIDSEEFGDEPLINVTQFIQNNTVNGFANLETLLKRRQELVQRREQLLAQQPGAGAAEPAAPAPLDQPSS